MSSTSIEFNNLSMKRADNYEQSLNKPQHQSQQKLFNNSYTSFINNDEQQQKQQHQSLLNIFLDDLQLHHQQLPPHLPLSLKTERQNPQPENDYIMADYIDKIGTRINLLETELKFAWRALDLLSSEYSKIWSHLEKLENITVEQQTVVTNLLDLFVKNNNNNKKNSFSVDGSDFHRTYDDDFPQLMDIESEIHLEAIKQQQEQSLLDYLLQENIVNEQQHQHQEHLSQQEQRKKLHSDSELTYQHNMPLSHNRHQFELPAINDFSLLSKAHSLNQLSLGERLAFDNRLYRTNSALNTDWGAELPMNDSFVPDSLDSARFGIEFDDNSFFHPLASKLNGKQTMPIQDTGGGGRKQKSKVVTDLFGVLKKVSSKSRTVVEITDMERLLQQSEEEEKSFTNSNTSINLCTSLNIIQEQEEIDEQSKQQMQSSQLVHVNNEKEQCSQPKKKQKKKKKQYKTEMEIFNNLKNSITNTENMEHKLKSHDKLDKTITDINDDTVAGDGDDTLSAEILAKILEMILNEISKIKHLKPLPIEQKQLIAHTLAIEQVFFEKLYQVDKNLVQLLLNPVTLSDQLLSYADNEVKKFEIIQEKLEINIETIKKLLGGRNSFEDVGKSKSNHNVTQQTPFKKPLTVHDEYSESLKRHNSNLDEQLKLLDTKEQKLQQKHQSNILEEIVSSTLTTNTVIITNPTISNAPEETTRTKKVINFNESEALTRELLISASQTNLYNSDAYVQELKKNLERHNSMLLLLHLQQQHKHQQQQKLLDENINGNSNTVEDEVKSKKVHNNNALELEHNIELDGYISQSPPPPAPNNDKHDGNDIADFSDAPMNVVGPIEISANNPFLCLGQQYQLQQQTQLLGNNNNNKQQQHHQPKCESLLSTTSGFSSSWERSSNSSMELSFDMATATTPSTNKMNNDTLPNFFSTLSTTTTTTTLPTIGTPYLFQQYSLATGVVCGTTITSNNHTLQNYQDYAENFNYLRELSTNMPISSAFENRTNFAFKQQTHLNKKHNMDNTLLRRPDLLQRNSQIHNEGIIYDDYDVHQQEKHLHNRFLMDYKQQPQRYHRSLSAGSTTIMSDYYQHQQQQQKFIARKSTNLTDYLAFYPTSKTYLCNANYNESEKVHGQQQQREQQPMQVRSQQLEFKQTQKQMKLSKLYVEDMHERQKEHLNTVAQEDKYKINSNQIFQQNFIKPVPTTDYDNHQQQQLLQLHQSHLNKNNKFAKQTKFLRKLSNFLPDTLKKAQHQHQLYQRSHSLPMGNYNKMPKNIDDHFNCGHKTVKNNHDKKSIESSTKPTTTTVTSVLKAKTVLKKLRQQQHQQISSFMQKAKAKATHRHSFGLRSISNVLTTTQSSVSSSTSANITDAEEEECEHEEEEDVEQEDKGVQDLLNEQVRSKEKGDLFKDHVVGRKRMSKNLFIDGDEEEYNNEDDAFTDDDYDDDDDDGDLSLLSDFDASQQNQNKIKKYHRKRKQPQQHLNRAKDSVSFNKLYFPSKITESINCVNLFATVGNLKQQQQKQLHETEQNKEKIGIHTRFPLDKDEDLKKLEEAIQESKEETNVQKQKQRMYDEYTTNNMLPPLPTTTITQSMASVVTTTTNLSYLEIPTTTHCWYSSGGSGDETTCSQQHRQYSLQKQQHRSYSSSISSRRQSTEDSIDTDDEYYCYELRQLERMEYEQKQEQLKLECEEKLSEQPKQLQTQVRDVSNKELFSKIDQLISISKDGDETEEKLKHHLNEEDDANDGYVKQMMNIVLKELKWTVKTYPAHDEQQLEPMLETQQQRRKSSTNNAIILNRVTDMQKAWQDYQQDFQQQQVSTSSSQQQQQQKRYKKRRLFAQMTVIQTEDFLALDDQHEKQSYSTDTEEEVVEAHNKVIKNKRKLLNKQKENEEKCTTEITKFKERRSVNDEIDEDEDHNERHSMSSVTTSGPDTPYILSEAEEEIECNKSKDKPLPTPSYENFRKSLRQTAQQQNEGEQQQEQKDNLGITQNQMTNVEEQHKQGQKQNSFKNGSSLSTTSSIDSSTGGISMHSKWKLLKTLKERKIEEKSNQNKIKEDDMKEKEREKNSTAGDVGLRGSHPGDNPFYSNIDSMPDIRPRRKSIPLVSELVSVV